jgi:hypothetical protein
MPQRRAYRGISLRGRRFNPATRGCAHRETVHRRDQASLFRSNVRVPLHAPQRIAVVRQHTETVLMHSLSLAHY